jgi:hypothetical protein
MVRLNVISASGMFVLWREEIGSEDCCAELMRVPCSEGQEHPGASKLSRPLARSEMVTVIR